jgi:serine/threonine protein phosphatase PrpC
LENHAGARFCRVCGVSLVQPAAVARPAPTQQLVQAPRFTPLAKNELLHGDRYQVQECLRQGAARNTYLVQDWGCARCGRFEAKAGNFCENCGASLEQQRVFLLIEGVSGREVAGERLLVQKQVQHPRLVNYHAVFESAFGGAPPRSYVLADPITLGNQTPGALCARRLVDLSPMTIEDALHHLEEIAPAIDDLFAAGLWLPSLHISQLLLVAGELRLDAAATVRSFDAESNEAIPAKRTQALGQLLPQMVANPLPAALVALLEDSPRSLEPGSGAAAFVAALQSAFVGRPVTPGASGTAPPASTQSAMSSAATAKTQPLATAGSAPLLAQAAALSDLGNVREINEDSLVKVELELVHNSVSQPLGLYAVADGMGGHAAGEVASMLAAQALTTSLMGLHSASRASGAPLDLRDLLKSAGQSAARAVYDRARQTQTDMGTTLVAALVDAKGARLYAINVGDSRLYKMSGRSIRRVTKDHSMVQLLIDKQQLTPAEAHRHPNANLIYRTLGDKPVVEIDLYEEPLAADDALLLCSDGLSGLVEDQELAAAVDQERTPEAACRRLVALAKDRGGHDNITVIIVQLRAAPMENDAG